MLTTLPPAPAVPDAPTLCGTAGCIDPTHGTETFCDAIRCPNRRCGRIHRISATCRLCRHIFGNTPTVWVCTKQGLAPQARSKCLSCGWSRASRNALQGCRRPRPGAIYERAVNAATMEGRRIPTEKLTVLLAEALEAGDLEAGDVKHELAALARDWPAVMNSLGVNQGHRTGFHDMTARQLQETETRVLDTIRRHPWRH